MASSKILDMLINEYATKEPQYISNIEINEFFIQNREKISYEDYIIIKNYFFERLKAPRKIFFQIEKWFKDTSDNDRVSVVNGKNITRRIYPRHYNEYKDALELKRYSPKTITMYIGAVLAANNWLVSHGYGLVDDTSDSGLRAFFMYMTNTKKSSLSSMRIHRFAISYYFTQILGRNIDLSFVEGLRDSKHLPVVLTRAEIQRIFSVINNIKHRTMLALMYSSGLRLSELLSLRVRDVCLEDLTIHVKEGKGRKDRITIFSEKIIDDVRRFMRGKESEEYLFQSTVKDARGRYCRLSGRTVQKVLENALKRSGIAKKATPHDLRHSFATHLLENGISIRHIQHLLGHKNITTTTIYTKVYNPRLKGIKSPL